MDLALALQYIRNNCNSIEQARLRFLLDNQPASPVIVVEFCSSQKQDGSWSPFWATNYSSLDATCFHLAQAHQLGIKVSETAMMKAVAFIANRQRSNGAWEEEQSVAEIAPSWAKPGNLSAKLYLTANCGYWLAIAQTYQEKVGIAGSYLVQKIDERGQLPSFMQTHWLAVGIWRKIEMVKQAEQVIRYLETRLGDFSANNLTWMITALRMVDIPAKHPLIAEALDRLMSLQQKNGSWPSDDGSEFDIHTTLEALFALKLCEKM